MSLRAIADSLHQALILNVESMMEEPKYTRAEIHQQLLYNIEISLQEIFTNRRADFDLREIAAKVARKKRLEKRKVKTKKRAKNVK